MSLPLNQRPVYLDCDTGIDDSLALAYLLSSPLIDLVGVGTVSGNVSSARAAVNTLDLLALAGRRDIPVAVGAHDPQCGTFDGGAPDIHGDNGVGNIDLPESGLRPTDEDAPHLLVRLSHMYHGELIVVTVGPTTNIAAALRLDPELPTRIQSLTIMGGAALVPGNVTAVAEANIWNDPEAASEMLSAEWNLTLVPLDVTLENTLDESDRQALLASDEPFAQALGRMLDFYFDFYITLYGKRSCALHDPLAAAIASGGITPTRAPAVDIVVDTSTGPGRGQTLCDLRGQRLGPVDQPGKRTRVVLDTDRPFGPHLIEQILAYSPNSQTS